VFTASGSFNKSVLNLKHRALKAYSKYNNPFRNAVRVRYHCYLIYLIEQFFMKVCKHSLGVNKSSSNAAVLSICDGYTQNISSQIADSGKLEVYSVIKESHTKEE
jgi:hypothetical protein